MTKTIFTVAMDAVNDTPAATKDEFDDLDSMRIDPDFVAQAGVEEIVRRVPVRKPTKTEFFTVNPNPAYQMHANLIVDEQDYYLILKQVAGQLADEYHPFTLYTCVNRQKIIFLWPCRLPGQDGRINDWHTTSHEAAQYAMSSWIQVRANPGLGAYTWKTPKADFPPFDWSQVKSFNELLRIAFVGRTVKDMNHPIVRKLDGGN